MTAPTLGLRANLAQFSLLVVVNAFVGAMVGMERSILPPIAEQEFGLEAKVAILSFIVVFGVSKALTNYLAGRLSDAVGRKRVLIGGWLVAAILSFNEFTATLFVTGQRTQTLPVAMYTYVREYADPTMAALSTMLIAATAFALAIANRFLGLDRILSIQAGH